MPADMPDYEILAGHCPPGEDCPKVARTRRPGKIAIVGKRITNPAVLAALGVGEGEVAVEINESLYREGSDSLDEGAVA
jgi:hypothetical protein